MFRRRTAFILVLAAAAFGLFIGLYQVGFRTRPPRTIEPRQARLVVHDPEVQPPNAETAPAVLQPTVQAEHILSITILGDDNLPVSRAQLSVWTPQDGEQQVGYNSASGAHIQVAPGQTSLWMLAQADDYVAACRSPTDDEFNVGSVIIHLDRPHITTVRILDSFHGPISSATLTIRVGRTPPPANLPGSWKDVLCPRPLPSDEAGMIQLPTSPSLTTSIIQMHADGFIPRSQLPAEIVVGNTVVLEMDAIAIAGARIASVPTGFNIHRSGAFGFIRKGHTWLKPYFPTPEARAEIMRTLASNLSDTSLDNILWALATEHPSETDVKAYPYVLEYGYEPFPGMQPLQGPLSFRRLADFRADHLASIEISGQHKREAATLRIEFLPTSAYETVEKHIWVLVCERDGRICSPQESPDPSRGIRAYTFNVSAGTYSVMPSVSFFDPAPFDPLEFQLAEGEVRQLAIHLWDRDKTGTLQLRLPKKQLPVSTSNGESLIGITIRSEDMPNYTYTKKYESPESFRILPGKYVATVDYGKSVSDEAVFEIKSGETTQVEFVLAR